MAQKRGEVVALRPAKLACSACGATTDAACGCNAPYVPALARAAAAVAENPEMSDRAIAAQIGVSAPTVSAARRATVKDFTVEKRVGLDGRARSAPIRHEPRPDQPPRDDRPDPVRSFEEGPIAWNNRAVSAANMANYAPFETCPANQKMLKAIEQVIANWTALRERLMEKIDHGKA